MTPTNPSSSISLYKPFLFADRKPFRSSSMTLHSLFLPLTPYPQKDSIPIHITDYTYTIEIFTRSIDRELKSTLSLLHANYHIINLSSVILEPSRQRMWEDEAEIDAPKKKTLELRPSDGLEMFRSSIEASWDVKMLKNETTIFHPKSWRERAMGRSVGWREVQYGVNMKNLLTMLCSKVSET